MRTLPRPGALLVAIVLGLLAAVSTAAGPAAAQTASTAPLPTAPASPASTAPLPTAPRPTAAGAEGNSLPRPNSGAEPQASGDRGGWAQLVLMVLVFAAVAAVIGRIAWATSKRTRAKASGV
ncbi:MAG: hypothetical protein ACKO91_10620 [Acidimicrobiales bacterium]